MNKDKKPEQQEKHRSADTAKLLGTVRSFFSKKTLDSIWDKLRSLGSELADSFKNDKIIMILSILIAIGIWAVISINVYPTMEKVYYNVPVQISLENSYAEANQLSVMTSSAETVTVKLSGNRSQIGDIKAEDLTAQVDVSSVMLPRTYKLSMNIDCGKSAEFEVVSIDPPTVSVSFDKIISKELEITPQLENVRIAEGYMSGDAVVTPSTVTVTGPQDTLTKLTKNIKKLWIC